MDITREAETIGWPQQKNNSQSNYRENKVTEVGHTDSLVVVLTHHWLDDIHALTLYTMLPYINLL